MIVDGLLKLSDSQAVTAAAISANIIDREGAEADIVAGEPDMFVVAHVTSAAASNPTTSMTIALESDSTADLATAPVVHATATILAADLTAGSTHVIGKIGGGGSTPSKRYVGGRYTPNGGNASTGAYILFLTPNVDRSWPRY